MPYGSMLVAVIIGAIICYLLSLFLKSEPWRSIAIGIVIVAVGFYLLNVSGIVDWLNGLGSSSPGRRG